VTSAAMRTRPSTRSVLSFAAIVNSPALPSSETSVPGGPSTVAVNEVRNRIYVGNGLDKTLTIIDGNTMRIVRTVSLPAPPIRIDADAGGQDVAVIGWAADPAVMIVSDPNVASALPSITAVTQGAHGTVTLDAKGNVTYTAIDGFSGSDSYTYTETDGEGGTATGTVNVTVIPRLSIAGSLPVP